MNYFDDPNSKHFSFESFADGLDEETFGVINFKGFEAISRTYDFEIYLVSSKKDIDLEDMLQSQAVFTIHRGENDDVLYNGILSEFDQLHEVNDVIFYRARLVPKLWWLTLTHHNQVFLDQSVPEIVEDALRDGGLETSDFDVGGLGDYEDLSYSCQYDESHFNFVSRCMERQGIYYYFTQESDGEVLMLTDTRFSHEALKEGAELFYNPASGLEGKHLGEAIGSFTCRQKQLPAELILKDYNYERPSLDITSTTDVDPSGRGVSYLYGEYFSTAEEGERLANIRAEELLCQKQEFFGESTVPYIMPGFTFNMNNHYREDFNQEYLILEVTHEGNQSHLMSTGIATETERSQNQSIYRNTFKAIPNETQYRPLRITEKPKISGTIHAKIDSEVDSEYAQIDEQGRYRVRLPFDINDEHMDGKGSAPVRMMQSYAGKNRGMQFPLVKGTEVLLTFIEGNPDRPVIAGAVSNPETQSPVNADNLNESVIQTGGNNQIRLGDQAGQERIVLNTPQSNSWIRMGCHNDPVMLNGNATMHVGQGDSFTDPGAFAMHIELSGLIPSFDMVDIPAATRVLNDTGNEVTFDTNSLGQYTFVYESGRDRAQRTVFVHDVADASATHVADQDGIRIKSGASLWMEAGSRFGSYKSGKPALIGAFPKESDTDNNPSQTGNLLSNFGSGNNYNPTNLMDYKTGQPVVVPGYTTGSTDAAMVSNDVEVSSLDTFSTQEGNVYDFGGYWSYNLGNGYTENHIDQCAKLNDKHDMTWPSLSYGAVAGVGVAQAAVGGAVAGVIGGAAAGFAVTPEGAPFVAMGVGIAAPFLYQAGWSLIGGAFTFNGNVGDVIYGPSGSVDCDGDVDDDEIKTWAGKVKLDKGSAWVDKSIGDSYEFKKGDTLEITNGDTESHTRGDEYEYTYGGVRESHMYNGKGIQTHWESNAGGIKQEATFDTQTGALVSYEFKNRQYVNFDFNLELPSSPKFIVSASIAPMTFTIDAAVGMSMEITAKAAVEMKMDFSKTMTMEVTPFKSLHLKIEQGKIDTNIPFFENHFKTTIAEQKVTELTSLLTDISTNATAIKTEATKVGSGGTDINAKILNLLG